MIKKNDQPVKRCAIYCRKSTEEGLEQEFNSLDAQRHACELYVSIQREKGWVCLPEHYDDGGYSGGNTNRPGLKKLLADAKTGKVDVIVVYKIDRLSRSLRDFLDLSQEFDQWNVGFVSVTQDINTQTPACRVVVNILMSFAQYERELGIERTRDKMAASRLRGRWMGGNVPFGYRLDNRRLYIDPKEAEIVTRVFRRFLEVQSPRQIVMELNVDGSKTRQGIPWVVPRIKHMLGNYHYIGKVNYKGNVVEGEQDAIIDQELWDQVQAFRCENKQTNDRYTRMETIAPLKGVLRCGHCNCAMAPTYTKKHGRRYFYYKCQKDSERGISLCPVKSISAGEIEHLVYDQLVKIMQMPEVLVALEQHSGMETKAILAKFDGEIWPAMNNGEKRRLMELLVEKAEVREDGLTIEIRTEGIKSLQAEYIYKDRSDAFAPGLEIKVTVLPNENVSIFIPLIFRKHAQRRKIIVGGNVRDSADLDPLLVSIARGRRWQRMIDDGIFVNSRELAKAVGRDPAQVASNLRIAMLAPDIVHQIITGNAPKTLTSQTMRREIPELWTDQIETFLGKRETPSTRSTSIELAVPAKH